MVGSRVKVALRCKRCGGTAEIQHWPEYSEVVCLNCGQTATLPTPESGGTAPERAKGVNCNHSNCGCAQNKWRCCYECSLPRCAGDAGESPDGLGVELATPRFVKRESNTEVGLEAGGAITWAVWQLRNIKDRSRKSGHL